MKSIDCYNIIPNPKDPIFLEKRRFMKCQVPGLSIINNLLKLQITDKGTSLVGQPNKIICYIKAGQHPDHLLDTNN
jgi:hypothetical protein